MSDSPWYRTRGGRGLFGGTVLLTLAVAAVSVRIDGVRVPLYVYVYGLLGALVYVFTSFANRFADDAQYQLKMFSRTVAAIPLVAGVYLLSGGFLPTGAGDPSALQSAPNQRLVAGLVFLTGLYVSTTLKGLGRLAERLLGVEGSGASSTTEAAAGKTTGSEQRTTDR